MPHQQPPGHYRPSAMLASRQPTPSPVNAYGIHPEYSARTNLSADCGFHPLQASVASNGGQSTNLYSYLHTAHRLASMPPDPRNAQNPSWPLPLDGLQTQVGQTSNPMMLSMSHPGNSIIPAALAHGYQQLPPAQGFCPVASTSYVGVIGADRPTSNQNPNQRLHSSQNHQQSSIFGGTGASPQQALRNRPTLLPSGPFHTNLGNVQAPSQPTPPPQHYDPNALPNHHLGSFYRGSV